MKVGNRSNQVVFGLDLSALKELLEKQIKEIKLSVRFSYLSNLCALYKLREVYRNQAITTVFKLII